MLQHGGSIEERLHDEMDDAVDKALELEIDDDRLSNLFQHAPAAAFQVY
jgi:hypothetical protein